MYVWVASMHNGSQNLELRNRNSNGRIHTDKIVVRDSSFFFFEKIPANKHQNSSNQAQIHLAKVQVGSDEDT